MDDVERLSGYTFEQESAERAIHSAKVSELTAIRDAAIKAAEDAYDAAIAESYNRFPSLDARWRARCQMPSFPIV